MSFLPQITPIVLTWNEEPNIRRVFDKLAWAQKVVVVDSGSTDQTLSLLATYRNVAIITRPFTTHSEQWNHALTHSAVATEWVLSLDADYVLSDELVHEMQALTPPAALGGYAASFVYWSMGRPLRGSLYPPRVVLFRRSQGRFVQDGHTQRLQLDGPTHALRNPIHHDDRKDLARWLRSQAAYAELEAQRIGACSPGKLTWSDRLRRTGVTPLLAAFYALFVKRCVLDGRAGLYYATQRAIAEAFLALKLWGRS
jgi:glycosyltransferase involved in cell wall biosynthesis